MDVDARAWIAARGRRAAAPRPRPEHEGRQGADRRASPSRCSEFVAPRPRRRGGRARAPGSSRSPRALAVAGPRRATDLHFYPRLVVDVGRERARGRSPTRSPPATCRSSFPHAPLARGELVVAPEAITPTTGRSSRRRSRASRHGARPTERLDARRRDDRRRHRRAEPRVGDVVIEDDRIASVGGARAARHRRSTPTGLVAAPGFVDIHSHVDWIAPLAGRPGAARRRTCGRGSRPRVAGNCGISPAPLGDVAQRGAIERMLLVGLVTGRLGWNWRSRRASTSTRSSGAACRSTSPSSSATARCARPCSASAVGRRRRASSRRWSALLAEGLRDGAVGLSVGLEYFPGRYAGPSEVEELARIAAAHDGLVAVHTRGISELFDPAIDEALGFARARAAAGSRSRTSTRWDAPTGTRSTTSSPRVDAARAGGARRRVRHRRLHGVDDDRVGGAPARRRGPRRRRRARARARRSDGRAHLRGLVERARPAWPPWVEGRVTRNVLARDGLGRALPRRRGARLRGARGDDARRDRAGARGATRSTSTSTCSLASGGAARIVNDGYGGDREDDGAAAAARVLRPDAIPETDTVPVAANGERLRCRCRCSGARCRASSAASRATSSCSRSRTRCARITSSLPAAPASPTAASCAAGAFADVVLLDFDVARRPRDVPRSRAARRRRVGVRQRRARPCPDGTYDPSRLPGRALRAESEATS